MGPLLSKAQWNDALKRCGFDGLRIALSDGPEETHGLSLIVSSVIPPEPIQRTPSTAIVWETREQNSLAVSIKAHLDTQPHGLVEVMPTDAFAATSSEYDQCICLWELGRTVMDCLNDIQFKSLQRMMAVSKEILWINDSCGERAERHEATMVAGFPKNLARERPKLSFAHLNVELGLSTKINILKVIDQRHMSDARLHETDLLEQLGAFHVPRAVEAPHVNQLFDSVMHQSNVKMVDSDTIQEPLKLTFVPGQLESFQFMVDKSVPAEILKDEIEICVKATGINFKDVLTALNRVHANSIG